MKHESNTISELTNLPSLTPSNLLSLGDNVIIEFDEAPPILVDKNSAEIKAYGIVSKVSTSSDISGLITSRFHISADSYIEASYNEDDISHSNLSLSLWTKINTKRDINDLPQEDQIRQLTSKNLTLFGKDFERIDIYVLHEITDCESEDSAHFQESRFTSLYESFDGVVIKSVVDESESSGAIEYWQKTQIITGEILAF